ncbi:GPI ethanolamine phosphate transferase 2 isoform X2 [Asparagus officinalis]|nr:GPI ethanolamine phosphate transferase 2 isoform X2 [Asparagus officinalis]
MSGVPPAFDRLILMVVDGLPAEFVLGRGEKPPSRSMMDAMPYTQSLLSSGKAIGFRAKAAPPTVTMPRLKAMVSGAIGSFLDVAFNFNTQALLDDNLLDQLYRIGWKMVMLGDNTWIKLFPRLFTRQDGVHSFFVKDTVEVDFNVSRHLEAELAATDWNLLILHYLGLDHVGHIGGRRSMLMTTKLKEMDEVIKMIHIRKILHQDNLDNRTLLVLVSDHGMTEGGNHGGSSYEETDSLALFIGGDSTKLDYAPHTQNKSFQVDLAPTLALLLGVPIPTNNIGVLLMEAFSSLTDKQMLRALQLNSWQLLRLLQAHLPGFLCSNLLYRISGKTDSQVNGITNNTQERLYYLFSKASAAHKLWEQQQQSSDYMINNTDDFKVIITLYYDFLRSASEWLSHKATDKPFNLLLCGVAIMVTSCLLLLKLLSCVFKEVFSRQKQSPSLVKECSDSWHLDELFVALAVLIHAISLNSSSMVEEEQYTWHFLVSTLYLIFLLTAVQSLFNKRSDVTTREFAELKIMKDYQQILSIIIVLICGRLLRGWHQGGVNWVDLPDISKWLEQVGVPFIKSLQIFSLIFLMVLASYFIGLIRSRTVLVDLIIVALLASGLLVCFRIVENWSQSEVSDSHSSNSVAQIFYLITSVTVAITVLSAPWIPPVQLKIQHVKDSDSRSSNISIDPILVGINDSMYLIGMAYAASWCLLQLLIQQPINSIPVLLIFSQLIASIIYFSADRSCHRQWVEVIAIYFLGMAGHFGLGNSNSLATIDVAGAYIGISSHSTIVSGVLMFFITYASPILSFLSMVMYISLKNTRHVSSTNYLDLGCILQTMIGFPCLLPLILNSIVLTTFTIVLLLMRDHLFIWSVFSPKYVYTCATTLSVYVGVLIIAMTGVYVCAVVSFRAKALRLKNCMKDSS